MANLGHGLASWFTVHRELRQVFLLAGAVLALACSGTPDSGPSKLEASAGKADGVVDELCEQAGAEPGCDICQVRGWYGDGLCDGFCDVFDYQDCSALTCADLSAAYSACRVDGGSVDGCVGPDQLLAQECCESATDDYCVDLGLRPSAEDCAAIDDVLVQCVAGGGDELSCALSLDPPDANTALLCCGDFPASLSACPTVQLVEECTLLNHDWTSCVFEAMGDDGLTREQAEATCADSLSGSLEELGCCSNDLDLTVCDSL